MSIEILPSKNVVSATVRHAVIQCDVCKIKNKIVLDDWSDCKPHVDGLFYDCPNTTCNSFTAQVTAVFERPKTVELPDPWKGIIDMAGLNNTFDVQSQEDAGTWTKCSVGWKMDIRNDLMLADDDDIDERDIEWAYGKRIAKLGAKFCEAVDQNDVRYAEKLNKKIEMHAMGQTARRIDLFGRFRVFQDAICCIGRHVAEEVTYS